MVILINNKTKKEFPIKDTKIKGQEVKAIDVAIGIMKKYPTVFTLKEIKNEKSKAIIKDAKSKDLADKK